MTKSVNFTVGVSMHGNGTSPMCVFHLQYFSPPGNRIVQHTKLASSLFAGAVLALWCLVLFNDCVQPCFKPKTIKPKCITDLDLLFASEHKVIRGSHRPPETSNPKAPQSFNLTEKADLIPNNWGLVSSHRSIIGMQCLCAMLEVQIRSYDSGQPLSALVYISQRQGMVTPRLPQ